MPNFIRTKSDENRWKKAKKATSKSRNKEESSFSDRDWALTTHIYQNMGKSDSFSIPTLIEQLNKIKTLIKQAPNDDESSWERALQQLPEKDTKSEGAEPEYDPYSEESEDEGEEPSFEQRMGIESPTEQEDYDPEYQQEKQYVDPEEEEKQAEQKAQQELSSRIERGHYIQPTAEELDQLREYTRPYGRYLKHYGHIKSDPSKNPLVAREGRTIEAFNEAVRDKKAEFEKLMNSDEFKNASAGQKIRMRHQFEKDWTANNPDHNEKVMGLHGEAQKKAKEGIDAFNTKKEEYIKDLIRGGAAGQDVFDTETGLQHAGATRDGEEGTVGSVTGDPVASFAAGNKDFVDYYSKIHDQKHKKASEMKDIESYSEDDVKDMRRILGDPPEKSKNIDLFFSRYWPTVQIGANKAIKALGLSKNHPNVDMGMLHEAGMHGLIHAINTYDPQRDTLFTTHAVNCIRNAAMGALKNVDPVHATIRTEKAKFEKLKRKNQQPIAQAGMATPIEQQTTPPPAISATSPAEVKPEIPKASAMEILGSSSHSKAKDMQNKLSAIKAQKGNIIIRRRSGE